MMPRNPESDPSAKLRVKDQIPKFNFNFDFKKAFKVTSVSMALAAIGAGCKSAEQKISHDLTPTSVNTELASKTPQEATSIHPGSVDIQIDSSIDSNISNRGKSIDVDVQAIKDVASMAPLPDALTAVITKGFAEHAEPAKGKIYVGRDHVSLETEKYEIAHEIGHVLDVKNNLEFFKKYYTPEQIKILMDLREQALTDPTWGRDYPSVEKILADKVKAITIPRADSTLDQRSLGSDTYANAVWITGRKFATREAPPQPGQSQIPEQPKEEPTFSPFDEDLKPTMELINQLAAERSANQYQSLQEFVYANSQQVDQILNSSEIGKFAAKKFYFYLEKGVFSPENTIWGVQNPPQALIFGRYQSDWFKSMQFYIQLVANEQYSYGELKDWLSTQSFEKQIYVPNSFEFLKDLADSEKFPEIIKNDIYGQVSTSVRPYLEKMNEFNIANGNSKDESTLAPWQRRYNQFNQEHGLVDLPSET